MKPNPRPRISPRNYPRKSSRRWSMLAVLTASTVVLLWAEAALACPNCKQALADQAAAGGDVGQGFYYSILVMMSAPFLLAGGFGVVIHHHIRKQQRLRSHPMTP